jgi:type II secretory pathway predicted ATPase ExeA
MTRSFSLYTDYFCLSERPFSLLPDPDFLYWTDDHKRAYTMLEYGVATRAPITLITGEVGAGKTTLLQYLLKNLDDRVTVGLVSNMQGDRGDLLRWVMMALNIRVDKDLDYVERFEIFQQFLIDEYAAGRHVLMIFDEAQNMPRKALEELRMLTNINSNKDELLQLLLIGQPELRDIIRRPDMKQFAQRIASSFHLSHMDQKTVYSYIVHRLEKAGGRAHMFSREASDMVHEITGGTPRLVNQLCDICMLYAATSEREIVGVEHVKAVLRDGAYFTPDLKTPDALASGDEISAD